MNRTYPMEMIDEIQKSIVNHWIDFGSCASEIISVTIDWDGRFDVHLTPKGFDEIFTCSDVTKLEPASDMEHIRQSAVINGVRYHCRRKATYTLESIE
jgi:hypothetical protein